MTRHRYGPKRSPRRSLLPGFEPLEARQVLSAMIGLTSAGQLAAFESTHPDLIRSLTTITGLQPGETVLGIDSRPATGQIYGLGSTGRLYTFDPVTGLSGLVGSGPIAAGLSGTEFDLDFNPVSDTLRVISNSGLNLRVNPNTAEVTIDSNLAYAPIDAGNGTTPSVVAAAYTNNVPGALNTTLYDLESSRNVVVSQGTIGGVPISPNTGQLLTLSAFSLPTAGAVGFEITPDGEALVSSQATGASATLLSSLSLNTGLLTPVGTFSAGVTIRDITSLPRVETVYAVTISNTLIAFRSNTPGTLIANVPILGLQPGEVIASLDVRPSTGQLYGLGSTGRLYVIQAAGPTIGQATPVSVSPINPLPTGTKTSIDFDPVTDRIRLVTNTNQDLRIDPNTGAVLAIDAALAYSGADLAAGTTPSVVAQAFTNNMIGASSTTLFGLDSARDSLILQGSVAGAPVSPNTGQLFTVGGLGRDISDLAGLDISSTGLALASISDVGTGFSTLTLVNLQTGALTPIGVIGGGVVIRDVAIASAGLVQFSAAAYSVSQTDGTATIVVTRLAGDSGPVQVAYRTSDGTARAGVNYTAVSGVLDFADGETVKTFTVPIRGNSLTSGSRTVNLILSPVTPGVPVGPIGTAVLTIDAFRRDASSGIATATFVGSARSIESVNLTFRTPLDGSIAGRADSYLVRATLARRHSRTVVLKVTSATFDPITGVVHLEFSRPFALRNYRTLQISARGLGENGFDAVAIYSIQRGSLVRYTDFDGDRVTLGVFGRRARVVVLNRLNEDQTYAWIEGEGRRVFGFVGRRRGSNRQAVIDRFVTNGARLRLPNSIVVNQAVIDGS